MIDKQTAREVQSRAAVSCDTTEEGKRPIAMTEEEVLRQYSTPGLRKNALTPREKRDQLRGMGLPAEDIEAILDRVYGVDRTPRY